MGAGPDCKECVNARGRKWRAANRERANAHNRRRKLAKLDAIPPDSDRETREWIVAECQSGRHPCAYCGEPAVHAEHAHPIFRGGHEAEWNIIPACATCNRRKFVTPYSEYVNRIGGVREPLAYSRAIPRNPSISHAWKPWSPDAVKAP